MEKTGIKKQLPPRLTRQGEFNRVRKSGRRYRLGFMTLVTARAPTGRGAGIGFVVPLRLDKRATRRNRIRRLMKEAARKWWHEIRPGYDILMQAFSSPEYDHMEYVESVFLRIAMMAGILKKDAVKRAESRIAELVSRFPKVPAKKDNYGGGR